MALYPNISLAILSGGKSLRMGGLNKGLLEYKSENFVSLIHKHLSHLFGETIIITNNPDDYKHFKIGCYRDIYKGKGPLGGIHSALQNANGHSVFVVSCDMPFANSSVANILLSAFIIMHPDALVPTINGMIEPLFALYAKSNVPALERFLEAEKNLAIRNFLKEINVQYLDLPDTHEVKRCFTNVNTPEDLDAISNFF